MYSKYKIIQPYIAQHNTNNTALYLHVHKENTLFHYQPQNLIEMKIQI